MQFSGRENLANRDQHQDSFSDAHQTELAVEITPLQCYNGRSGDVVWGFSSWGLRQASSSNPFPVAALEQAGLQMLMAFDNGDLFQGDRSSLMDSYFPGYDPATQVAVLILTGGEHRQEQTTHQVVQVSYLRDTGTTRIYLKEDKDTSATLQEGNLPWTILLFNKEDLGSKASFEISTL